MRKSNYYFSYPSNVLSLTLLLWAMVTIHSVNAQCNKALTVAPFIQSNMIFQQKLPITIWGTGQSGCTVSVSLGGKTKSTFVRSNGHWNVIFDPLQASTFDNVTNSYQAISLTVNDKSFSNILIGEVWIFSGQSNMNYTISQVTDIRNFYENLNSDDFNNGLRMFVNSTIRLSAPEGYTEAELERCNVDDFFEASWQVSDDTNSTAASSIAWYTAYNLQQNLNVPVGFIQYSLGGSAINNWIDPDVLRADSLTSSYYTTDFLTNEDIFDPHKELATEAMQNVLPSGDYLVGQTSHRWLREPGFLFEASLDHIKHLRFKGVAWYQGETDAILPEFVDRYEALFPMLVESWRNHFDFGNFPFLYVQLPGFRAVNWPQMREVQRRSESSIDNSYMVVTIDTGDENDIHPLIKQPIGDRLVNLALDKVYGFNTISAYSIIDAELTDINSIELTLSGPAESGRLSSPTIPGFEVTCNGINYQSAEARFNSDFTKVIIECNNCIGVRYGWEPFPNPKLEIFSKVNLPLSPFEFARIDPKETSSFTPDPNKKYYIDVLEHKLRLGASGQTANAFTTDINTGGADVEWQFVQNENGYWHIQRADGGAFSRLRTDNTEFADLQSTALNGSWTYYSFNAGASAQTHYITLPEGPCEHQRLQVLGDGELRFVSRIDQSNSVSFTITEVPSPSTPTTNTSTANENGISIYFKNPLKNASFNEGELIGVTVLATDSNGDISSVELFINNTLVRQENVSPYNWGTDRVNGTDDALQNLSPGTYELRALATDDSGNTEETSISITIIGAECMTISDVNFESGFEIWNDGGEDCGIVNSIFISNSGTKSVELRDASGAASSMFTDPMNLDSASEVEISFSFLPVSFEKGANFLLEVSTDGGSTYNVIKNWIVDRDFTNNVRQLARESIRSHQLSNNTVFRIRCDASGDADLVFIDDVVIEFCQFPGINQNHNNAIPIENIEQDKVKFASSSRERENLLDMQRKPFKVKIYPNPANTYLLYEVKNEDLYQLEIFDTSGKLIRNIPEKNGRIDLTQLNDGLYFLVFKTQQKTMLKKFTKRS